MASSGHFGPALQVVAAFDPAAGWKRRLQWEDCYSGGDGDEVAFLELERAEVAFPIEAEGGGDGLGHPVEGDVGEELVAGEAGEQVAVTVGPVIAAGDVVKVDRGDAGMGSVFLHAGAHQRVVEIHSFAENQTGSGDCRHRVGRIFRGTIDSLVTADF
jgi:hypothetical protein